MDIIAVWLIDIIFSSVLDIIVHKQWITLIEINCFEYNNVKNQLDATITVY